MKIFSHDLITDFKKALCGGEKSPRTVEKYLRDVSAFFAWAGSAELDKSAVLSYKEQLCARYAPQSVNSILSSLNSFFFVLRLARFKGENAKAAAQHFCGQRARAFQVGV